MSSGTKFFCLPTSRAEARSLGLKHYDNGKLCPKKHALTVRLVKNGGCFECNQIDKRRRARKWELANPEKKKAIRLANKDKEYETNRQYRLTHPEEIKEYNHQRYVRDKIGMIAKSRAWWAAHPEKARARKKRKDHRRRVRDYGAEGDYCDQDIADIFDAQRGSCTCGKALRLGYHIDHKTPLSRGGSNWPSNLQLLCPKCNITKGTRTDEEWRATFPT